MADSSSSERALERNVGGIDRGLRAVFAVVLAGIGVVGILGGQWLFAGLAFVAAGGLTFNVVTGFCGINAMLGINTCTWDGKDEKDGAG